MKLTLKAMVNYVGKPASALVEDEPFSDWSHDREEEEIETDDDSVTVISYLFPDHGMDVICDSEDRIQTITLYNEEDREFAEVFGDFPMQTLTQIETRNRLGDIGESHEEDPDEEDSVAWDRFDKQRFSIIVEYNTADDKIKKMKLISLDVAKRRR